MALPEQFAQFILRMIFDQTEKSVSKIYKNVPIFDYPLDVGGGIDDLCSLCFLIILKAQKAFLEAHKRKVEIKSILLEVSKGEDFEHLFKFLREEALNEKEDYFCRLKSALSITRETYDEEFDRADSEEAETYSTDSSNEAESYNRLRDGSEAAETYTTDGSNEVETYKKDGFEEAETCNRGGSEIAEMYNKDGSEIAGTHNNDGSEEAETLNGSDSDGTKSCMEVDEASSDEKTVFQVSSTSSDEEIVDIGELMWRLRAQMMNFVFELNCFSQGCDVEPRMDELYQEVLKAEEYSFEQAMMELKGVIPSVILEQFQRSADEAHKAGSESADSRTMWGSALLGISIQNGGKGLQATVEKLDRALSLDSDRTDTLCYASCAYGSLYCLTFGSPESEWYLNNAKTCIAKAVREDLDEDLFTKCLGFIDSLEARMVSGNKELRKEKRKYSDAFV